MAKMLNIDGDPVRYFTVHCDLHISAEVAVKRLISLVFHNNLGELLLDEDTSDYRLTWVIDGADLYDPLGDDVKGYITITENCMTAKVNSASRANQIRYLLNRSLEADVMQHSDRG